MCCIEIITCEDCMAKHRYIKVHGKHFSDSLLSFAVGELHNEDNNIISKSELVRILNQHAISYNNDCINDYVYLANMVLSDYYGSSIEDERHMAKYIHDTIHDKDGYEGMIFCRWLTDAENKGVEINWDEHV